MSNLAVVYSPKLCLKMPLPNCLSHKRGLFSFFQNCPRGEGNCETTERQKLSRGNFCLAGSRCLSRPSYRAMPFRDSIAEGGIARVLPSFRVVSRTCRWDIPFVGGGAPPLCMLSKGETRRKGGGAPNRPCWDTRNPVAHNRGYRWDSLVAYRNTGPLRFLNRRSVPKKVLCCQRQTSGASAMTTKCLDNTLWHEIITKIILWELFFRNFWGISCSRHVQKIKTFSRNYPWDS